MTEAVQTVISLVMFTDYTVPGDDDDCVHHDDCLCDVDGGGDVDDDVNVDDGVCDVYGGDDDGGP